MNKQIMTLGLAGTILLGSVSFAETLQKAPENKQIAITQEVKNTKKVEIKDSIIPADRLHDIKIRVPEFKGLSDKRYEEELNFIIKTNAEKDLKEFKEEIKNAESKNLLEAGSLEIDYEVKSEGDIISVVVSKYSIVKGQANGESRVDYYNIDTLNNRTLELEDIFKKESNYKEILNKEISDAIKEDSEKYFKNEDENKFETVKEDTGFYFDKEGNLIIAFDKYEIAPGSTGIPEFKIEKAKIKDILMDLKKMEKSLVSGKIVPIAKIDNIKVRIPVIEGLEDKEFEKKLNKEIEESANKSIESFRKENSERKKTDGMESEFVIDYEVKSEANILSIGISEFKIFSGDANPEFKVDYYNIDTLNNKTIQLKDLFKDGTNYKEVINKEINIAIEKDKEKYFLDENKFNTIDDNQKFYIDKNGDIVVVFEKYEIGPGSTGRPEITLNSSSIKSIRKAVEKEVIEEKTEVEVLDRVIINSEELILEDAAIRNEKGVLMFPMVEIGKKMEYEASWDGKNRMAVLNKGSIEAKASVKENQYSFARALVILDNGAELVDGRTFVPAEFFNEVLKLEVSIDNKGIFNINY